MARTGVHLVKPVAGTPINWGNPLTRGLITCLPIWEGAGVPKNILSPRGIANGDPLLNQNVIWTAGKLGRCLNTAGGSGDFLQWPDPTPAVGTADWTLFGIASIDGDNNANRSLLRKQEDGASGGDAIMLKVSSSNVISCELGSGGSTQSVNGATSIAVAAGVPRTFGASVKSSSWVRVFLDGRLDGSAAYTASTSWSVGASFPWQTRYQHGNGEEWNGNIWFIGIWERAFSDAQMAAMHADPWQIFAPISLVKRVWIPGAGSVDYPESITLDLDVAALLTGSAPHEESIGLAVEVDALLVGGITREESIQLDAEVEAAVQTSTQFSAEIQLDTEVEAAAAFGYDAAIQIDAEVDAAASALKSTTGAITLGVEVDYAQSVTVAYTASLLLAAGLGLDLRANVAAQEALSFDIEVDIALLVGTIFSEAVTIASEMDMDLATKLSAVGLIALAVAADLDAANNANMNVAISAGALMGQDLGSQLAAVESVAFGVEVDPGIVGSKGQADSISLAIGLTAAAVFAKNPRGPSEFTPGDGGEPGIFKPSDGGTPGIFKPKPASSDTPGFFKPTSD